MACWRRDLAGCDLHLFTVHLVGIFQSRRRRDLFPSRSVCEGPQRNTLGIQMLEIRDPRRNGVDIHPSGPMERNNGKVRIVLSGKNMAQVHPPAMGFEPETLRRNVNM